MGKSKLKFKKYLAGLALVLLVVSVIGLLKIGNFDKLAGKIKIEDAHLANASSKLNANIFDIESDNAITSNGYDEINYEIKYKLSESDQARDVIILGTLNDDEPYASFKKVTGNNITSTLSNNNRRIEIVINDVPANTEITTNIALLINGTPDGYTVNPRIQIKESTSDEYGDIHTYPVEVNTNNLRGIVRNQDNQGISNIIISLYKNDELIKETYTNSEGNYIFSDIPAGTYTVKINEEIYQTINEEITIVAGDRILDILTERVYPFNLEVHKYITKVDAYNNGALTTRSYDNVNLVNFPIDRLNILTGKVYYKIVVQNTGEKEGTISLVKDELPEFMTFNAEENSGFELKDGIIYDRNLEGITLYPGETREDSLVLNILDSNEARTYLNRVNVDGEIYEHVVYILDGNTYKEQDVLEGETITRPADPIENFGGWYTDNKYTNLYNYNNPVTKDLVLYGKTTQKYNVEFYDKNPETGDETLYDEEEVPAGDPVGEPENHPEYTGYDFNYWCTVDNVKYIFSTPVTDDLKLITCYTIKQYDVNFYNYQDTIEKTSKVEYKHLIDESEAPTFDETGYTFICWTTDKENCYDFTTPVTDNLDLYPKHERLNNAVVFNDENRITTVEVPYGDTTNPIANQGKEGHTFRCFSEDRENCFDFATPIIKNTTVYAIYDINHYTVSFIDRDPEGIEPDAPYGDAQIIEWNGKATRPTIDPTHTGYTFSEWTKTDGTTYNFATPVTEDIVLISKYNINTYPVRFHNDSEVTTVNAQYKHKVTPIESPTKDHYIFSSWLDINNLPFDFDTLIVEETDLYASFEEVLPPKISHTPTMWTNSNVTVNIEKNDLVDDDTGYSYLYKTDESTYSDYEKPFTITENTTIIAKSVKQNVDSVVSNREIRNIDKLNPTITLFSENSVNRNNATLNVSSLDNESGINYYEIYQDNVKVGEKHFECYNETDFDSYEECRSDLPIERVDTYTVTGLSQSTTYTFKVKVYDKAGNFAMSDEIEVTTTTPQIVARLIGYNGEPLQEENYINFESLEDAFAYGSNNSDLYDCQNVQCTIQMVKSTNESVQVLDTQDLTLDLNGKIVSGINSEYTIKNTGKFRLIDNTLETQNAGKLVNASGTAILNKTGSTLALGEGYSDHEEITSVVSITRPYVYGAVVGIKTEENSFFAMYDGKIVAPRSQTPGEGAVSGRVDATEYAYEAVSNTETIDDRAHQVVTLSILDDPEARINKSIYYSKLSTAVNDANKGTTTIETEEKDSILDSLETVGIYGFVKDPETGYYINENNEFATKAAAKVIIDLRNEEEDKLLDIDFYASSGTRESSPSYLLGTFTSSVYKYANHGKTPGDGVNAYYSDFVSTDIYYYNKDNKRIYKLKKGDIYVFNINYTQPNSIINPDEEYTLPSIIIKGITLSDEVKDTTSIGESSDISMMEYSFYYDENTKTIRSNNNFTPNNSIAFGYTEIDLTGKEGTYDLIVNASMEAYHGNSTYSYGYIGVGEDTSLSINSKIYYSTGGGQPDVSIDETSANYGFTTYGPNTETIQLNGGKKYYLKYKYQKYVSNPVYGDYTPSEEDYRNANCSDQLIINSIDLVKKSDTSTSIEKSATEISDDNIISNVYDNSNGTLELTENRMLITNNTTPGQVSISHDTIDLTNDPQGAILKIKYNRIPGSNNTNINMGYSTSSMCSNCFSVLQKSIVDGQEVKKYVYANSKNNNDDYYYYFNLPGNYEYEFYVNVTNTSSYLAEYPNVMFDIRLEKLSNMEGNYFNGIYPDNPNNEIVMSSNTFYSPDMWRDSFIKIDLSNYNDDQVLTFKNEFYDYNSYKGYYIYLTDNNRALSREELFNNRSNEVIYVSAQGAGANRNGSLSSHDYNIVLEKGNIYYLHFAGITMPSTSTTNYISSYGNWSMRLYDLKLTPVIEKLMTVGDNTIFTGTVDVAVKPESKTTIKDRETVEPNIHSGDSQIYDFVYNSETDMYDSQNIEAGTVAAKVFTVDLTESLEDKIYIFEHNNPSANAYYAISDSGDIPPIDINSYKAGNYQQNYTYLPNKTSFILEKGKVHYIQVITLNNGSNGPISLRLIGSNIDNTTTEFITISNEIRKFNEEVDTVQLLKDVNSPESIHVDYSEEVILDLNGHNLTSQNQESTVTNEGDLTIIDSQSTCEISPEVTTVKYFDYTGSYQTYTIPETGIYKVEAWGAQGGYAFSEENHGGYGGYAKGEIFLEKGQTIGVYVGGKGTDAQNFVSRSTRINKGYTDGDYSYTANVYLLGAGGGSSFILNGTTTISNTPAVQSTALLVAGGGGGAYARRNSASDSEPQTLQTGGNANIDSPNLYMAMPKFAYGSQNSGGGGGGWYTGSATGSTNPTSAAPGGTNHANQVVQSVDFEVNSELPSNDPTPNTYKTGNGHVRLTLVKSYGGTITNPNGTAIKNEERASLTLKSGFITSSNTPNYRNLVGIINNNGELKLEGDSVIRVSKNHLIGIVNNGTITSDNDNTRIILDTSSCSSNREYNTVGIYSNNGTSILNNINITGRNGVGVMVDANAKVTLSSSNINIDDSCNISSRNNNSDQTALSSYSKKFTFDYKIYGSSAYTSPRYDGSVYNKGELSIINGTKLVGTVGNTNLLEIKKGTDFNDFYQTNINSNATITDTNATVKRIINVHGTLNFGVEDKDKYSINSSNDPAVINFGTINTNSGGIVSLYNMGTLNSVNTDYNKLYNIHTYLSAKNTDKKGTANITGGTILNNPLVNEYEMVVNGVNVPNGIINRRNLVVKGNSVVTGNDKVAIDNQPFVLEHYNTSSKKLLNTTYTTTSVTLGEDDSNVLNSPSITTTNGNYAITGACDSKGSLEIDDDFNFDSTSSVYISGKYNYSYTLTNEIRSTKMDDYPNYKNLCEFNYYDGTIKNNTTTDMTDVVDIPITGLSNGYDTLYSNDNGGLVILDTIDSNSRINAYEVNNTPYKSLETAISNTPDGGIINVTNNISTANRVTIPENKNITLNYLIGNTMNSYSRDALITNNGNLTVTGDGVNNVLGAVLYDNNGTLSITGSTHSNNIDNYFKQSNIFRNNNIVSIDDITSNGLDMIDNGSLILNDGMFKSNTIFADNSNIIVKGGYFDTASNNNYHDTRPNISGTTISQQSVNTKPMFNVSRSRVTFDNFDTTTDSRYSNIQLEQDLGKFTNNSILTLNNSNIGGNSSKTNSIYSKVQNSVVNILGGTYNNNLFYISDGSTYYQSSGTVNGKLLASGSDNAINVVSGKILSANDIAVDLLNASNNTVTLGTKGDLNPDETIKVSKTDPEILGSSYGIVARGTTIEGAQNELYFYDGIVKASDNPIDLFVREYEEGYDLVFNRKSTPKEKYLDILPIIHNYTTGVDYYNIQQAFNEANVGDELIFLKDYSSLADSPSIVVGQNKEITLYLSYDLVPDASSSTGYKYVPYKNDGSSYTEIVSPIIQVNNEDIKDPETGLVIEEKPFIMNNGNLTIVGGTTADGIATLGSLTIPANIESVSGARIVINNEGATLNLDKFTAINIKNMDTMFKNSGTMNVVQSHFETLQSNLITNTGTLKFDKNASETSTCYNPTFIKVHRTSELETAYKNYGKNAVVRDLIINNGTMNMAYVYIDTDYTNTVINNSGTAVVSLVDIEQYGQGSWNFLDMDNSIINNGDLTMNTCQLLTTRGIINNNILTANGVSIDAAFGTAIVNRGKLTTNSINISGGGTGITDTGLDTYISGGISTAGEAYNGSGPGNVTLSGVFTSKGQKNATTHSVSNKTIMKSCSNGTASRITIGQNMSRSVDYKINSAVIYVDNNRNVEIANSFFYFLDLPKLEHFCGYYTKNNVSFYYCGAPYVHENEDGKNYTVSAIEANNANINIATSTANHYSSYDESTETTIHNDYTYGMYLYNSNLNLVKGSSISRMYIENTNDNSVTFGEKDGTGITTPYVGKMWCSPKFTKGLNYYDGVTWLDTVGDKYCSFADTEDNRIIIKPAGGSGDGSPFMIMTMPVIANGESSYTTIEEALGAASPGDTLKLIHTVAYPKDAYDIAINKNITLDLNGNILDANLIIESGTTTITDSAHMEDSSNNLGRITNITNTSGSLVVNDGRVVNVNNTSSSIVVNGGVVNALNTSTITSISGSGTIDNVNNTGEITVTNTTITKLNNSDNAVSTLNSAIIKTLNNNDNSTISMNSDTQINTLINRSSVAHTYTSGSINTLENYLGNIEMNGVSTNTIINTGEVTINAGNLTTIYNSAAGNVIINAGNISKIENDWIFYKDGKSREKDANGEATMPKSGSRTNIIINNGTVGSIKNYGNLVILGGQITSITNKKYTYQYNTYVSYNKYPTLTIGEKDGTVSKVSPKIYNPEGPAVINQEENTFNFYDGILISPEDLVIEGPIDDVEENYEISINVDYDEQGYLTGTSSMILKKKSIVDTKIACVNGICYGSIQEAIDASVQNYSEETGCPNVIIGDEVYFSLELDEDLILDPQYSLTIDLNHHNINDNGHDIPENITLINGSRNGEDIQSSLARFLSNVFDSNNSNKNIIIITNMSDGNMLDTAKTYNLYKYEDTAYLPIKVDSDGAGKYSMGKDTTDMKPIKGRLYLNNMPAGEYKLKDNYDNELEFTIYDDGSLSPNVTENIISEYGHISASAVATLIINIQTGIIRVRYILITLLVLGVLTTLLLMKKNKSKKKETM